MTMSTVGGGPPPALSLAAATCVVVWQFLVEDAGHRAGSVAFEEKGLALWRWGTLVRRIRQM